MNDESGADALPPGKQAGVCLHMSALPGRYGIGTIGREALRFIDAMRRMQLGTWQFLPTGPPAYGDSPYLPLSTFAGNEMLIDLDDLVAIGLLEAGELRPLAELPEDVVDFNALLPLKTALLGTAADRFRERASSALKAARDDFLESSDAAWLHDYALFRILKARHGGKPWPDWETSCVHRESRAMRRAEADAGRDIEIIKTVQFFFFHQWRRLRDYATANGVRFFGDVPIYIALDSADAWANRDILQLDDEGHPDAVAGVPPDYFSADGQLWGNPLYDWEKQAASRYRWWIDRLQAAMELADMVRIDHFRAFEAYWSVPATATTARDGRWVPGPGDAIFDAIQQALGKLPIVAENLGVITPEVEELRARHDIPGMVVLQFEVENPDFSPASVAEDSVCYTGTHDNDTTRGWFTGNPGDVRTPEEIERTRRRALEVTGGTPETIHEDLTRVAFSTPAKLAIVPMQDYLGLGSEARFNTPGTAGGNWRWRLGSGAVTDEFCDRVAGLVHAGGREPVG